MHRFFYLLLFLTFFFTTAYAQVTIGSDTPPNESSLLDFNENGDGSSSRGILFPRVALVDLDSPTPLKEHVEGMMVYNTATSDDTTVSAQAAVYPGTYYNDGRRWVRISTSDSGSWFTVDDNTLSTSVSDDIYHLGDIAVGTDELEPSAQLQVSSSSKGVLIPRMTKADRDAIKEPTNGLMIFNTGTNCLNYYNDLTSKWMNLCGGYEPATIDVLCNLSSGPLGTFTESVSLNASNTYTVVVDVTSEGTYELVARSTNGYSFSKSGLFTSTGKNELILDGQGVPLAWGEDIISIEFNGVMKPLDCDLPKVTIKPGSIVYTLNPTVYEINGIYTAGTPLDATNYIEVEVNVTTPGVLNLRTSADNGILFESGSMQLEIGVHRIKLMGRGTPINSGFTTGVTIAMGDVILNPVIEVKVALGTFDTPANRCQEILDDDINSPSGYYWIKDANSNKYRTYCMMERGNAWTLVKSVSERQILVVEKTENESLSTQKERNIVNSNAGIFNEYAFSLPSKAVANIGAASGTKLFKFTIKEVGHTTSTTATKEEVEQSTIPAYEDSFAKDNYWDVSIVSGNPATGNFTSSRNNNTTEGKLFGVALTKPDLTTTNYYFDGVQFRANPYGMYSSANFFTGFYGAQGSVALNTDANNMTYTYSGRGDEHDGKTFVYNKYYINDLFGIYMNSEPQLNHHIGTCSNSDDDFGGASYCARGWASWRAHRFNLRPDGEYEGRILQYWVK